MSTSTGTGSTSGRVTAAVIFGIIAIAFLVVGVIFSIEPAGSLPSWLGHETIIVGKQTLPSPSYHPLRAVGSLITGVVFAIGSLFTLKYKGQAVSAAH